MHRFRRIGERCWKVSRRSFGLVRRRAIASLMASCSWAGDACLSASEGRGNLLLNRATSSGVHGPGPMSLLMLGCGVVLVDEVSSPDTAILPANDLYRLWC